MKMIFPKSLKIVVQHKEKIVNINGKNITKYVYNNDDLQLANILSKAIGFDYELVISESGGYGTQSPDGNWTGMVGMIQHRKTDLVVTSLGITEERSKAVHFSYPFQIVPITFVTSKPGYSPELTAFMSPFSNQVWIFFVICLMVITCFLHILLQKKYELQEVCLFTCGTFLRQPCTFRVVKFRELLLVGIWLVAVGFLSYCYTALLLSFISFPSMNGVRTIYDLSEAVKKGKYFCTSYKNTYIVDSLAESADNNVKILGKNLKHNEGSNDIESVLQSSKGYKKPAFIGSAMHFAPLKNGYFISEDIFFPIFSAIAMQKDFCCKKRLDYVINHIVAGGIYLKIADDEAFRKSLKTQNLHSSKVSGISGKLTLNDTLGIFYLLIAGHMLSLTVLLIEIMANKLSIVKKIFYSV